MKFLDGSGVLSLGFAFVSRPSWQAYLILLLSAVAVSMHLYHMYVLFRWYQMFQHDVSIVPSTTSKLWPEYCIFPFLRLCSSRFTICMFTHRPQRTLKILPNPCYNCDIVYDYMTLKCFFRDPIPVLLINSKGACINRL